MSNHSQHSLVPTCQIWTMWFFLTLEKGQQMGLPRSMVPLFRVQTPLKVWALRAKPSGNEAICPWEQNEPLWDQEQWACWVADLEWMEARAGAHGLSWDSSRNAFFLGKCCCQQVYSVVMILSQWSLMPLFWMISPKWVSHELFKVFFFFLWVLISVVFCPEITLWEMDKNKFG